MNKVMTYMKFGIFALLLVWAAGRAYAQFTVIQQIRGQLVFSGVAGDRFVCGQNPVAYTCTGACTAMLDYTVPANKTINGTMTITGNIQ